MNSSILHQPWNLNFLSFYIRPSLICLLATISFWSQLFPYEHTTYTLIILTYSQFPKHTISCFIYLYAHFPLPGKLFPFIYLKMPQSVVLSPRISCSLEHLWRTQAELMSFGSELFLYQIFLALSLWTYA